MLFRAPVMRIHRKLFELRDDDLARALLPMHSNRY